MNPFIFQFKEPATEEDVDFSEIEYDQNLNLSVDRRTSRPAVESIKMATETSTKVHGESSDTDSPMTGMLMATETITLVNTEGSDSDHHRTHLLNLLFQQ